MTCIFEMGKKQEFETTKCIILVLHVKIKKKSRMCMCTLFECQTLKNGKSVETTGRKKHPSTTTTTTAQHERIQSAPNKWMSYYLLLWCKYSSSPSSCIWKKSPTSHHPRIEFFNAKLCKLILRIFCFCFFLFFRSFCIFF